MIGWGKGKRGRNLNILRGWESKLISYLEAGEKFVYLGAGECLLVDYGFLCSVYS